MTQHPTPMIFFCEIYRKIQYAMLKKNKYHTKSLKKINFFETFHKYTKNIAILIKKEVQKLSFPEEHKVCLY